MIKLVNGTNIKLINNIWFFIRADLLSGFQGPESEAIDRPVASGKSFKHLPGKIKILLIYLNNYG